MLIQGGSFTSLIARDSLLRRNMLTLPICLQTYRPNGFSENTFSIQELSNCILNETRFQMFCPDTVKLFHIAYRSIY